MRSDRLVPILVIAYYVAMLIVLTYPGYVPFSRIRPFVLGMPFALFWQVLWVSGAVVVLGGLFLWESERGAESVGSARSLSDDPRSESRDARRSESNDAGGPRSGDVGRPGIGKPGGTRFREVGDMRSDDTRDSESGGESSASGRGLE